MTPGHEACVCIVILDAIRAYGTRHRHLLEWALALVILGLTIFGVAIFRVVSKLKRKEKENATS